MPCGVGFWGPLGLKERARRVMEVVTVQGQSPSSQPAPSCPAPTLSLSPSIRSVWFYPLVSPSTTSFLVAFSWANWTCWSKWAWHGWYQTFLFNNYHWIFRRHNFAWAHSLLVPLCASSEPTGHSQPNLGGVRTSQSSCIISHVRQETQLRRRLQSKLRPSWTQERFH